MRQLNGVYTQSHNARHHRTGHIFQGRYKAILIQRESHLLEVCRYVVLNPVRAKVVQVPEQWKWSSYRATAGKAAHACLTTEWILGQFGKRRKQAEERYREFVHAGIGGKGIWDEVKGQTILGDEHFAGELIGYVRGARDIPEIPRMQRYVGRPELKEFLKGMENKARDSIAQKVREAVEHYGYTQREVADFIGLHYSTVSRLLKRQEH